MGDLVRLPELPVQLDEKTREALSRAVTVPRAKGPAKWESCPANVVCFLEAFDAAASVELDGDIWEDEAGLGRVMVGKRALSDDHLVKLQSWMPRHAQFNAGCQFVVNKLETIGSGVNVFASRRKRNPIRKWLLDLKWDHTKRLKSWAATYLGVEPSEYASAAGAWWMQQAAARGLEPGCQADYALILYGEQGTRKSSAVAALVPDAEWYLDTPAGFGANGNKDQQMLLARRLVVELGEMQPLLGMTPPAAKQALTRRTEPVRIPWGHYTVDYPRTCSFIATTNESATLRDPTGARRFWPLHVTREIDVAGIVRDREQLWAEAVQRHHDKKRRWPETPSELAAFSEVAEEHRAEMSYEGSLRELVDQHPNKGDKLSYRSVWNATMVEPKDQTDKRAAEVRATMRALGWERLNKATRIDGQVTKGFVRL